MTTTAHEPPRVEIVAVRKYGWTVMFDVDAEGNVPDRMLTRYEISRSCGHPLLITGLSGREPLVGSVVSCLTCWSEQLSHSDDGLVLERLPSGQFAWLRETRSNSNGA
jgi:hypothetical protein